jgi:hypothetical protein
MKLKVTPVQIGQVSVEGLTDGQGNFYVSVTQSHSLFEFTALPNSAAKYVKTLLGKDKTALLKLQSELNTQKVSVLTLQEFETLVAKLDRAGNIQAQNFRDLMVGLSLRQLFCDAFGEKFEINERQAYLSERQLAAKQFHPLYTCHCKADGCDSGIDYVKRVAELKAASGLPGNLSVNDMDVTQLQKLTSGEIRYDALRRVASLSHKQAIAALKSIS